ncbi:MAG TPA: uroporphyrinogen-III synthase, partial [Aequorivita sp.]|nr:uroporphyrinogen-III synthase [Aequorivita sp.]
MKSVLSTKKLSPSQRELLVNAGISLVDYNAINIEFVPFKAPNTVENAIFTSQNAVKAYLNEKDHLPSPLEGEGSGVRMFCVGE